MNSSASGSFSVATTIFVSLAICAVISYGIFYYFKQRLSVIEQSQMEQARIMQAIISRGMQSQQAHAHAHAHANQSCAEEVQLQAHPVHKEITITQNGLIEVSSDDSDSESESDDESSSSSDKWSIGDEIHQPDSLHESFPFHTNEKKHIHLDNIHIDSLDIDDIDPSEDADANQTKKIISLNKSAIANDEGDNDNDDDDDDDDDDDSSSSDEHEQEQEQDQDHVLQDKAPFELKIGYKPNQTKDTSAKAMHLNYANMSVPALRQLAKERTLGGDDADLQKLKKKDLVQLLTSNSI